MPDITSRRASGTAEAIDVNAGGEQVAGGTAMQAAPQVAWTFLSASPLPRSWLPIMPWQSMSMGAPASATIGTGWSIPAQAGPARTTSMTPMSAIASMRKGCEPNTALN